MKISISLFLIIFLLGVSISCKDELDVQNPNSPTTASLENEKGIIKFALGGIYVNGFVDLKYTDGTLGPFWSNGFHDMMADNIGAEAANVFMNQISSAESVKLDDNSLIKNPNAPPHQPDMLRQNNLNGQQGQNPLFYEWAYLYALNRSCNYILANVNGITFTGDAQTKKDVLKTWSYWWKGYAYSRLGSLYFAGLIVDDPAKTNNNYKSYVEILAEAENNFAKAEAILNTIAVNGDYTSVLGSIIPDYFQVGKGGIFTPAMWKRNINTMRARNILANKRVAAMTVTDWDQILTLTNAGILSSDYVFTGRSNERGDIITAQGTISAKSTGDPASAATYKISERLVQSFQPGDKRLTNNFTQLATPWIGNADRGNIFNTRWQLVDGGTGISGTIVYSSQVPGQYELYMAGSYEENELMKAEAYIYKNNLAAGTAIIDAIRATQGAGLAAIVPSTQAAAIAQLRSERRVALLFRNVAFYDARRYGVLDPLTSGGGASNVIVISKSGSNPVVVNTNAVIDYQYLDYWDVPDNEIVYNPAASGSAPTKNPKN